LLPDVDLFAFKADLSLILPSSLLDVDDMAIAIDMVCRFTFRDTSEGFADILMRRGA
jgi:hypothetical protein